MIKKFVAIILFFLSVSTALAQGTPYADFTSLLNSESIKVADVNVPSQRFKPLNDFVSGIDIFIDNDGALGTATINLKRVSNGQLLTSKTVSIPNIPPEWGGTQFHVSFNNSINVLSTEAYTIEIISSMPDLRLYYSDLIAVRQHNSIYSVGDIVLPAYLGSEEQDFAFHFVLYEKEEKEPPIISDPEISVKTLTNAQLSFHANEPVDHKIYLTPDGESETESIPFSNIYRQCNVGLNPCTANLKISPNASYEYRLVAKDEWGNENTTTGNFTALTDSSENIEEEPSTQLAISNARAVLISKNSATIAWTTNIAADSKILIQTQSTGGNLNTVAEIKNLSYILEHSLNTDFILSADTQYFANITSSDNLNNSANTTIVFSTPKDDETPTPGEEPVDDGESSEEITGGEDGTTPPDEETLANSEISIDIDTSGGTGKDALITLGWDVPDGISPSGGYRIDIFDKDNNLKLSLTTDENKVNLNGLDPGEYNAVVYGNYGGLYTQIGDIIHFEVPGLTSVITLKERIYYLITIIILLSLLIPTFVWLRRRNRKRKKKEKVETVKSYCEGEEGITILEIVISIGLLVGIISIISLFGKNVSETGLNLVDRFGVQQEIELTLNEIITEIRSAQISHEGSYPIAAASTSSMTFYTDKGGDGSFEKIRYFLDGNTLKKGIIRPSGSPLAYNPANEVVSDVVHNFVAGTSSIFTYYGEDFTGSGLPLTQPITLYDIRMIEIYLAAQDTYQSSPIVFTVRVSPRNLRSNL
jgi:hypothetical protein